MKQNLLDGFFFKKRLSFFIGFFNYLFHQSIDILKEDKWKGFLKKQNAS